ncbi:DUF2220 family protein [Micromonospora sp. WMMD1076]|uniref:Wadjet anti-phage system protein JetD domain-containing protein n=1 Tax=Micromonospora sp. WMMD1076 TaxID=3016103 RepID=UPI00249BB96C|nr:Wadjet anti-phage system protein JetD domain-containing protein [Micromonospora sp. WMMD1076]WFF08070.1 DUF2220 family protein [Micromonospora sp. WMMD1076]
MTAIEPYVDLLLQVTKNNSNYSHVSPVRPTTTRPARCSPMKSPDQIVAEIGTRLRNRWHLEVAGTNRDGWPYRASLGQPSKTVLEADFPSARRWALDWAAWADHQGLVLVRQTRRVIGTSQTLPTHLEIPDLDTAARLVGQGWPDRLRTARNRASVLTARFPHVDLVKTLPAVHPLTDIDFALLLDAARWFCHHDARGLTPRQVPIEGLHGKWLNRHHALIRHLSRKDDLGLATRPTRVHFTYLDPTYRAAGRRLHESVTIGDPVTPAYIPDTVLVLENKDTAVYFPPLPGGIAVEGEGSKAPGALPRIPWIRDCTRVIYWGDIDAAGIEIVNNLRTNGINAQTILMDQETYDAYERFGAWTDEKGKPIPCSQRKPLPALTPAERALYENLTDPTWTRVRRIEQERIPLAEGLGRIAAHVHNPSGRNDSPDPAVPCRNHRMGMPPGPITGRTAEHLPAVVRRASSQPSSSPRLLGTAMNCHGQPPRPMARPGPLMGAPDRRGASSRRRWGRAHAAVPRGARRPAP